MDNISKSGYLAGATRFRRISEKLYTDGDKIYRDHNINFKASWFSVFYILAVSEAPKTVNELAGAIGFTHITVKNVLRELEAEALARIRVHPEDKRARQASLTPKGKKLLIRLEKIWVPFSNSLKQVMDAGHPDCLNILGRIEQELLRHPINETLKETEAIHPIQVMDYRPSFKKYFFELAGNWLLGVLDGTLEAEDEFTLHHPDKAYLPEGGFVFFAFQHKKAVGCVALKRLNEDTFEFAKLFIDPEARKGGIATRLIERCISRCKENGARQLWLQTTMRMPEAHRLYYKLGFKDKKAPRQMTVLQRTEKIMVLEF